jgi:Flp pilus assembly protein TadB
MAHESHESVGGLVRGALDDVRELFREEVALAKAEVRQELSKAATAGMNFGIAGVSLLFAGTFLLIALALGIAAVFGWPAWAGFAIVAVLLAIVGAVMFASARRAVRNVQPLPRTVNTLKENLR